MFFFPLRFSSFKSADSIHLTILISCRANKQTITNLDRYRCHIVVPDTTFNPFQFKPPITLSHSPSPTPNPRQCCYHHHHKQFRPVASHAPAQNVTAGTRLVVETLTQDSAGSRAAKETKWQTKPKPKKKNLKKKTPVSASMPAVNLDARASKRAARPTDRPSSVADQSIDRSIACKKEHWRIAIKRASVVLQE